MNTKLTLVEATVYDNITEANGRQEVLNALREQAQDLAALRSKLATVTAELDAKLEALGEIASISQNGINGSPREDALTMARIRNVATAALKGGKG